MSQKTGLDALLDYYPADQKGIPFNPKNILLLDAIAQLSGVSTGLGHSAQISCLTAMARRHILYQNEHKQFCMTARLLSWWLKERDLKLFSLLEKREQTIKGLSVNQLLSFESYLTGTRTKIVNRAAYAHGLRKKNLLINVDGVLVPTAGTKEAWERIHGPIDDDHDWISEILEEDPVINLGDLSQQTINLIDRITNPGQLDQINKFFDHLILPGVSIKEVDQLIRGYAENCLSSSHGSWSAA